LPSGLTVVEQEVLNFTVAHALESAAAQPTAEQPTPTPIPTAAPPAQVPAPPVQLPSVGESLFQMLASVFGAQPVVAPTGPCQVGVSIAGAASQNVAQIGDTVTFSYTVTNLGTVPLTTVQAAAQLQNGLNVAQASGGNADAQVRAEALSAPNPANAGDPARGGGAELLIASWGQPRGLNPMSTGDPVGTVDPVTGYIVWVVDGGVAVGATTTLSLSTTVAQFGQWTPTVCAVGLNPGGDMVYDCEQVTTVVVAPTPTPTPSPTASATPTATATQAPTATPEATSTPPPTSRPRPNNASASTSTPSPTQTPLPTSTPSPTTTPVPTPEPTITPQSTNTTEPTSTPHPTNTPHPTATPHPTESHGD
jgi:uncharacterized repeat protein (TIGR01451 family)